MNHTLNLTYEEIDLLKIALEKQRADITVDADAFERQIKRAEEANNPFSAVYVNQRRTLFVWRRDECTNLLGKLNEATKI
jgi:hypothetical protein